MKEKKINLVVLILSVQITSCLYQVEVMDIGLDQCGITAERRISLIDKNRDLFLTSVRVFGAERRIIRLSIVIDVSCVLGVRSN